MFQLLEPRVDLERAKKLSLLVTRDFTNRNVLSVEITNTIDDSVR